MARRISEHGKADFNVAVVLLDAAHAEVAKFQAEWSLRASGKRA
jgi:hypothetical protein